MRKDFSDCARKLTSLWRQDEKWRRCVTRRRYVTRRQFLQRQIPLDRRLRCPEGEIFFFFWKSVSLFELYWTVEVEWLKGCDFLIVQNDVILLFVFLIIHSMDLRSESKFFNDFSTTSLKIIKNSFLVSLNA